MSNRQLHNWQRATVVDTIYVAENVLRFVLELPDGPVPSPGSHLDLLLPLPAGEVVRSYSIVDDGRFPGFLSIGVRLDPDSRGGSRFMHSLRPGDAVVTSQPVQTFDLSWGSRSYLLLAGGIGITPLIGMARRLRQWGAEYQLVHVGRTRPQMPFAEDLINDHPDRVQLFPTDERGRPDLDRLIAETAPAEMYVCGPLEMLRAAQHSWAAAQRPSGSLRFETFGSSGSSPALPFRIRIPRFGVEAEVSADDTLLDVIDGTGVEVMADCRRGECGLCVVTVIGHDTPLDHRDVFLSERQAAAGNRICACVSRAAGGTLTIEVP